MGIPKLGPRKPRIVIFSTLRACKMGRKYKTKFPMARIKKIMQLDNEIGKVALATPILISKALEVFMQNLVDEACKRVQSEGCTKLEPFFLKKCINETEEFDFLKDIVAGVDSTPVTAPATINSEESKPSNDGQDVEMTPAQQETSASATDDEESIKSQKHKCSISTMLNNDPATLSQNVGGKSTDTVECEEIVSEKLNESTE